MEAFAKAMADLNVIWYLVGITVILVILSLLFRRSAKLRPYTGQLLLLSGFVLITLIFVLLTFSFKVSKLAVGVSARSMPQLWAVLMLFVAALTLYTILSGKEDPDPPFGRWRLALGFLVAAIVSVALFAYVGYYLCSAAFILVAMLLLDERGKVPLVAVPVGWCVFTYLIFNKLLFISLPIGSLFEAILT